MFSTNRFLDPSSKIVFQKTDAWEKLSSSPVSYRLTSPESAYPGCNFFVRGHSCGPLNAEQIVLTFSKSNFHCFTFERIREVVGSSTLVIIETHWTITLIVLDTDAVRTVDGQLQKVCAQTMTMSVIISEETSLQHLVRARFDSRNQVSWRVGSLFNLRKIVIWIAVQCHATDWDKWKILLRPDFGKIEWIELDFLGFSECHNLDKHVPRWEFTACDCVVQVTDRIVRIRTSELISFAG